MGEQQTDACPQRAEQRALSEPLPDEPAAPGAERPPDRDFCPPSSCARQQQRGDVRARDEQDETHGREQKLERRGIVLTHVREAVPGERCHVRDPARAA